MIDKIHWLGQAAFFIDGKTKIYIDPYRIKEGLAKADIILITHSHPDHCSSEDIKKIYKSDTLIVGPRAIAAELSWPVKTIRPKESLEVKEVGIEAVYAYNPRKNFHPKSEANLGYILSIDKTRIYHAGDTDYIPEMKQIKADICLIPVGGTYTMDAQEAAKAVNIINPRIAVPMHWGGIIGSQQDAEEFKRLCQIEVRILKSE